MSKTVPLFVCHNRLLLLRYWKTGWGGGGGGQFRNSKVSESSIVTGIPPRFNNAAGLLAKKKKSINMQYTPQSEKNCIIQNCIKYTLNMRSWDPRVVKYVPLRTHVNILLLGDQLDLPEDYVTVGSAHKKLRTWGWELWPHAQAGCFIQLRFVKNMRTSCCLFCSRK